MDTVTVEAFDVSSYDRQQVFAMLPEGVGELGCQVLPRFLNDALDAEVTRRLPRPRPGPVAMALSSLWGKAGPGFPA